MTLADLLAHFGVDIHSRQGAQFYAALLAREDNMRDHFFLAAQQFGMFPEIVAAVVADAGLGSPKTDEEKALIRNNFNTLMERLRREHEQGGSPEGDATS